MDLKVTNQLGAVDDDDDDDDDDGDDDDDDGDGDGGAVHHAGLRQSLHQQNILYVVFYYGRPLLGT